MKRMQMEMTKNLEIKKTLEYFGFYNPEFSRRAHELSKMSEKYV